MKATSIEWLVASHTLPPYTVGLPSGGAANPLAFDDSRFQITREVARGGMGRILAAVDRRLGRTVAIKVALTNELLTQQRLGREAAILSSLSHEALPPIYELGALRGGLAYFVTRLVDGETLDQRLKDAPADWAAALPIVAEVAEVMDHVHHQGVVHRDLKPSNILIERTGRVVIVDWGIARRIQPLAFDPGDEALHDLDLTAPGIAIGTPGYWAPEQARGEPGCVASDVYSLGAIVFRMVAGRLSRSGVPAPAELPAAMQGAPRWLVDLVAKATARATADRHPSSAAFAAELRRGLATRRRRTSARSRYAAPVLAATVALGAHDARLCGSEVGARVAGVLTASGHWNGDFGEMAFAVSGDRVRAVYSHDRGLFVGRIVGHRIIGRWCEAPYASEHDRGEATLVVAGHGTAIRVAGHYRYAGDREWAGRWALEPTTTAAPAELTARLAVDEWRCGA